MGIALSTPLVGANTSLRTTEQQYALGTAALGADGNTWIYGRASGSVATGTCTYTAATGLITDAAGNHTADTSFAADEYGWVRRTTSPL